MKLYQFLSLYNGNFCFKIYIHNKNNKYICMINDLSDIDKELLNVEIDCVEQYEPEDIIYLRID